MEIEKKLIEKILTNDINGVKEILSENRCSPEFCDEHGMTPLQHAAYRGYKDMVQLLLDQGADVNSGKHEYKYTALHFGVFSGNIEVCQLLLEHGAKTHAVNSVGRTPSQMAAFVGNHACATVINNFVPKSEIDYYTVPSGFETEPKLPPHVSAPLHKFVIQVSLNPVRIAMNLMKSPVVYENIEKVKQVLVLMSYKEMRRGLGTNEIMSFKFHYLSSILAEIIKCKKSLEQQENQNLNEAVKKQFAPVEFFIKKMLKTYSGTIPEYQENFLKDVVKKFPNSECTIFRQMVYTLSRSGSPSALSVITSIINGQRGFIDSDTSTCATCGEEKVMKKCSQCKSVQYCDKECQRFHWFVHKKFCAKPKEAENKEFNEKTDQEVVKAATEELMTDIKNLKV